MGIMPKITNPEYRNFLDKGMIEILRLPELKTALNNVSGINGKHIIEGRAFIIALYYTGARPCELLNLRAKAFKRKDTYVTAEIQAAKRGLNRTIYLPYRFAAVKELYAYAVRCFPNMYLFHHYRSDRLRRLRTRNGELKEYRVISDNVYYHVKKWFGTIPSFLRHNRFSALSEAGLTREEIRQTKGAKTTASVDPYLHLSGRTAKKIARFIK